MKMLPQLEGKNVYSVRAIGDGALLGTSKGIYFYYFRNGNIVQLLPELKNEVISSIIYDDKTRNCWLASLTNGVYLIDDKFQVRENIITGKIIRNSLFRMLSGLCSWMTGEDYGLER